MSGSIEKWDGTTSKTFNVSYWDGTTETGASVEFYSGTGAPPPPPPGTPTEGLAFDLSPALTASSPKLVFAHYFPPYPRSLDNKDPSVDYYANGYLAQNGESGSHAVYGGLLRNRPMGRAPLVGDYTTLDMQSEIDNARAAGLNGFFVDMLSASASSTNTTRAMHLIQVAGAYVPDGSFKVVPMVDTTASLTTGLTTDQLSDRIAAYAAGPSAWFLPDGRFVVSSFKGETYNAAWWDTLFTNMQTRHGLNVAFLMGLLSISSWTGYQGYSWSYGFGDWGDGADPGIAAVTGASEHSTGPHNAGYKWMQPVQGENVRPDQAVYDEAHGTAALRGWWERAVRNSSDYVQLVTWSDWSESGSVADSVNSGNVNLDISAWYLYKMKTGNYPTILKDVLYLSHRSHLSTVDWTTTGAYAAGERTFMHHWARGTGMSQVADVVEALVFATGPGTITINVGGTVSTFAVAAAGMTAVTAPLAAGSISASFTRGGVATASVTSTVPVTVTPYKDEWVYYRFSSERGTAGQFNPNTR